MDGLTVHSCICWSGPNAEENTRPPIGLPVKGSWLDDTVTEK